MPAKFRRTLIVGGQVFILAHQIVPSGPNRCQRNRPIRFIPCQVDVSPNIFGVRMGHQFKRT